MNGPAGLDARLERALFLRRQTLLRGFPAPALFTLERSANEAVLAAGDVVVAGGEVQDTLVVVVEGALTAHRGDRSPQVIRAGELAGLTHLLARRPPRQLSASEDSRVLLIADDELEDLIDRHFATVEVMVRHLARECLVDLASLADGFELDVPAQTAGADTLDFVDRLGILARSSAFPTESLDALAELARHAEERRWEPGSVLWRAGDPADSFLLVIDGAIQCDTGAGRHVHRGRGSTVGEYEALAYDPRNFTAVAADSLVALRIDRDLFFDVLDDHAGMARNYLRVLARRRLSLAALPRLAAS